MVAPKLQFNYPRQRPDLLWVGWESNGQEEEYISQGMGTMGKGFSMTFHRVVQQLISDCDSFQDDLLEEDRLMLDRSPDDELGSGDEDDSDSEMDDANETTHDGERTIYPWMKKIHVAGVGTYLLCRFVFVG